ncbi:MAG: NAD(P)-dependent alcohol dehydrogenase [Chloroflexi bacterium]|nr:NAD(P)-dependent alcohol dehydrogenase [Chloroflexota bacterium]
MKALVLNKPLDLEISDVPDPGAPPAGFVRVKVDTVGICGSDVHYYEHGRIGDFVVEKPMILGHETAGVIEATGEGVDGLTVGDHVAMEPGVSCGDCGYCESGRYNLCADMAFWATPPYDGSLAEYVVHPARFTYKLPIGMSLEEGALIEPLSVAVHAANRVDVLAGETVAINGAGTIGAVCVLVAKARGAARIIVTDVSPERLERAIVLGADVAVDVRSDSISEPFDVGMEASGHPESLPRLIHGIRAGGRIAIVGMANQNINFDSVTAGVKEIDIHGVFRYANTYPMAIDLVASAQLDIASLVTHRFAFEDAVKAFEYAIPPLPATGKILIKL